MDFDPTSEEKTYPVTNANHQHPKHEVVTFEKRDVYVIKDEHGPLFGGVIALGNILNSDCCGQDHYCGHVEDLLVIAADRLAYLNQGEWACPENDSAIQNINAALLDLSKRAYRRQLEEASK